MWSHFTSQFSMTVFTLLWGFPFLVRAQGLSPTAASTLLMVMVGWVVVERAGARLARRPATRTTGPGSCSRSSAPMVLAWTAVLVRSEPSPLWLLVVMVCLTASGGPASMIGFDLARTYTPIEASGRANGIVNIGGFGASLMTMAPDRLGARAARAGRRRRPTGWTTSGPRMSVQYIFWAFGICQILRYRYKALAHLRRLHPGAIEQMKRGEPFVHPGIGDHEGV